VEADSQYWIQTDGEPRGSTQATQITVKERALKLLTPPRALELLKNASVS
jgi:hypothetical protein